MTEWRSVCVGGSDVGMGTAMILQQRYEDGRATDEHRLVPIDNLLGERTGE